MSKALKAEANVDFLSGECAAWRKLKLGRKVVNVSRLEPMVSSLLQAAGQCW